ncbi:hypothetical protein ACFWJ2_38265 [Streptomyces tendae]|uniref:hypothetical protein n=1 Tax=Streptomyces tendae TaxID=1932 RepID=UPI003651E90B
MSEKWDVRDIAAANFNTFVDARTQKRRFADYAAFLGVPLLLGVGTALLRQWGHFHLYDVSKFIGGIGVFTGLLFGLLTNVFTLSLRLQRDDDLADHDVALNVRELFANVSWAVAVGLTLVVLLVVTGSIHDPKKPLDSIWTGVLVSFFSHLILIVLMSLKRIWLAHASISRLPPKG